MFTYPKQFSDSGWLPFSAGPRRDLINDRFSSFEDFTDTPENWLALSGYRYTPKEMESHWGCLLLAKIRVESYYRVQLGLFKAYDPAFKVVMEELRMNLDGTPDLSRLFKPNCKETAFKRILATVESKVSEGWDRLRASFDAVRGTGKILTDSQWERLTGSPQLEAGEPYDYAADEVEKEKRESDRFEKQQADIAEATKRANEPIPDTDEDDTESLLDSEDLLLVTIDATGEQVECMFLEEDVLFVTIEEEPRILNPEDVTL